MKIAQVAPLIESVPPRYYGGTERVVSYLTEELVRLGHDVTQLISRADVTESPLANSGLRSCIWPPWSLEWREAIFLGDLSG